MKALKNSLVILLVATLFSYAPFMLSATIGSDISVDRFTTQQTLNNGDKVAGFAALEAGFKLFGISTTATYDSFFSPSGEFNLNGGTLVLTRDLILRGVSSIKLLGDIVGNDHVLELAATVTCLPNASEIEIDYSVSFLTSQTGQPDKIYTCDWSFDSKFVAIGMDDSLNDSDSDSDSDDSEGSNPSIVLRVFELSGSTLPLKDEELLDEAQEVVVVRWHPSDYFLAVGRSQVSSGKDEIIIFSVNSVTGQLTEVSGAEVNVDVYALAWHPSGDYLVVGRNISGSEVAVYSVDGSGNISASPIATYDISPDRSVQLRSIDWDATGDYIAVGVQTSASDELLVLNFNAGGPSLSLNASVDTGKDLFAVDWNQTCTDLIAIGLNGSSGALLRVYEHNAGGGTLTQKASRSDLNDNVNSVGWSPDGNCLALLRDSNTGKEFRLYFFDKNDFSLTEVDSFNFVYEQFELCWSPDGGHIAVVGRDRSVKIYSTNVGQGGDDGCVVFTDLKVFLNCNLTLKNCCIKFSGNSVLNGQGHCLTLQPTCTLSVDMNSSLLIKDIIIKGINDHRIQCMDDSSTITFKNVEWIQDGDFTFTVGHFDVLKDFHVIGDGHKFIYQSSEMSTIDACGRMILDDNVTFSYDPPTDSRDLLKLLSDTSQLILQGATLHSTTTGLQLTKGKLFIDGRSCLFAEGTIESEAISFGDGTNAANNLDVHWAPAACLQAKQGLIVQNDA